MSAIRRFTDFILRGRVQAMATAFVLGFIPLIGLLGSVIAALVTLRKGIQEGALVFIAAVLPILLLSSGMSADQQAANSAISVMDVIIMIVAINVLAWVIAVILRRTSSWSLVLDLIGLLGVVVVIALHFYFPNMSAWWQHWLTNYLAGIGATANDAVHSLNLANTYKNYATGLAAIIISLYALLDLLLARWWQDKMFNPGGLRKELMNIRLGEPSGLVFVIGAVAAFKHITMAQDAMTILMMTFAFAGLSLMHYTIAATRTKWWWLVIIYIILTLVPLSIILLVLLGLSDTAFDFRKKIPAKLV